MANYDYTKDDPYSPFYEPEEDVGGGSLERSITPLPQGEMFPAPASDFSSMYQYTGYGEQPKTGSGSGTNITSSYRLSPTGKTSVMTPSYPGLPPQLGQVPEFTAPEYQAPDITAPGFNPPGYSEAEVRRLTHRAAAPGVRKLRQAVQMAMSRQYENPNVKSMTLRQALAGYGLGLEGVMAGASQQGRAEYGEKYGREFAGAQTRYGGEMQKYLSEFGAAQQRYGLEYQGAQTQYGAQMQALLAKYNAAMQAYLGGATKEEKTTYQYGGSYA